MSILAKDLGRGCLRSAVIQIIAVVIGLPLSICLIAIILVTVDVFYDRPVILWGIIALLCLVIIALPILTIVLVSFLRKRELDSLFTPLGLAGSVYNIQFRQYHGQVNGRQIDIYLQRGPLLQIEAKTSLQTRLGVSSSQSDTTFFANIAGKQNLETPGAEGLLLYPLDPEWTRTLLAQPGLGDALRRLTALENLFTRHSVLLRPGAFQLLLSGSKQLFGFDMDPAQVSRWVQDLLAVADIAERIPPPTQTDGLNGAEQLALKVRQRSPYIPLWIALAILGFIFTIGVIGAGIMIVILNQ